MSIITLTTDREHQALRDRFKSEFKNPGLKTNTPILASPLTNSYGIVGTAFDYLVRFQMEILNKEKVEMRPWLASESKNELIENIESSEDDFIHLGSQEDTPIEKSELIEIIETQYEKAVNNYNVSISSANISNELIFSSLFLAKLDIYFRTGIIDYFNHQSESDYSDLQNLISIFPKEKFIVKNRCILNPTFGEGSILVGGADADLIIDNTLIDIKVTKNLKLDRDYLNQIISYYLISLIGGINSNKKDHSIEQIGIYFARHAELWTIPIHELGDKTKIDRFKKFFIEYASNAVF